MSSGRNEHRNFYLPVDGGDGGGENMRTRRRREKFLLVRKSSSAEYNQEKRHKFDRRKTFSSLCRGPPHQREAGVRSTDKKEKKVSVSFLFLLHFFPLFFREKNFNIVEIAE